MGFLGIWRVLQASRALGHGFRCQRANDFSGARRHFREAIRRVSASGWANGASLSIQMQAAQGLVTPAPARVDDEARTALIEVLAEIEKQPELLELNTYKEWANWAKTLLGMTAEGGKA